MVVEAWEALVTIAIGIGVLLIGAQFRKQFFLELDPARERSDELYAMNTQLRRRWVAMFLTAGTGLIAVGGYFLVTVL
jgi:hypothetical protein